MSAEIEDDGLAKDGDEWLSGDPLLAFLAQAAALPSVCIDVSLLVGGVVVSGRLIDEISYVHRLADHFQRVQASQSEPMAAERDLGAMMRDQMRGFEPGAVVPSEYVHLKEATISRGAGDVSHVALWRGAARDVDGWSVG